MIYAAGLEKVWEAADKVFSSREKNSAYFKNMAAQARVRAATYTGISAMAGASAKNPYMIAVAGAAAVGAYLQDNLADEYDKKAEEAQAKEREAERKAIEERKFAENREREKVRELERSLQNSFDDASRERERGDYSGVHDSPPMGSNFSNYA